MESVLVLIAAPGSGAIDDQVVHAVGKLAGAEPRWLTEREAVQYLITSSLLTSSSRRKPGPIPPRDDSPASRSVHPWVPAFAGMTELEEIVRNLPIDLAILPAANRRKRLLVADMDSTMIDQECLDELGLCAGIGERIAGITARAMAGELVFEAALRERVGLLRGLPAQAIAHILAERISFGPGGQTLVATMRAHGAHTLLVSGGFVQFTSHVAAHLGFDEHRANELLIENASLTGAVREPILGKDAKIEAVREVSARLGLTSADAIAVGDGANDVPMLQEAGLGVAFHAKPKVREAAPISIDHGDLTALLYLQGYSRAEFV